LNDRQQLLAERDRQTLRQRRHIAGELRSRKQQLAAELELHRAEMAASGAGQDLQLQLKLSELQGKYDRLREELDAHQQQRDDAANRLGELQIQLETRQLELQHQQTRLGEARQRETELATERQRLESERERLQGERQRLEAELHNHLDESRRQADAARDDLARRATVAEQQAAEIARLASEKIELQRRLAEAQQRAEEQAQQLERRLAETEQLTQQLTQRRSDEPTAGNGQETDDLRRRFEMAVQDVRELKSKNAELVEQLASSKQTAGAVAATAIAGQGWESLKQKLLAEMETDFDPGDDRQKADKLTVQGAIKITDEVVADKEREIEELRRLLASQAQQVGDVAVGAAAVAQMLDTDELIRQERDALQRMQEAAREQFRQAEIDISMERAKLARERTELEEKLRSLEAERANLGPVAGGDSSGDKSKKPAGRKWLARLGLGETDDA
jgi:hypothetical protein